MTPERQKWWDGLSTNEKYLRREILALKSRRSEEKRYINVTWSSSVVKKIALARVNFYTVHIRALKHELDRTTIMVYTGSYEGVSPIYRCEKCGGIIVDAGQWHCSWCGRKIKEWIESQKPDEDYSWVGDEMPLRKKEAK